MSVRNILMAAAGSADDKLYVDDVFSAFTYTGNGSAQTINNGIDLAGKGGMVWTKSRSTAGTAHALYDTVRGTGKALYSHLTEAQSATGDLSSFNSSGFSLGNVVGQSNWNGQNYISWTFRKAPKFFDVVTYTKPAITNDTTFTTTISNPGMVIIKRTSTGSYSEEVTWAVWHRSLGDSQYLELNTTNTAYGITRVIVSGTAITHRGLTSESAQFVAYVFAHDPSADGVIQCGSFTTDGSGNATVNLGWEPQYILLKNTTTAGYDWEVYDSARMMTVNTSSRSLRLRPNLPDAEGTPITGPAPSATGFSISGGFGGSQNVIYLAIRRPNKPPTTGTQVYNAIARTGTGAAATVTGVGFAPDAVLFNERVTGTDRSLLARLIGNFGLRTSSNVAEVSFSAIFSSFDMDGISVLSNSIFINTSGGSYINQFFRRAPGVFDVVCYTGTGIARTLPHNLGAVPELMIVKCRSTAMLWGVYSAPTGNTQHMVLNAVNVPTSGNDLWNNITPTASVFSVGTSIFSNTSAENYVAYLFASKAGISKVGSYTGNGTSQTIDAGFTTGARFALIKRTDSTGDWYIWDTTRGLVAGNDPHLSLNTTAAEVTTNDSVDPDASGFIVNQVAATNVNVTGATYLYLAIA